MSVKSANQMAVDQLYDVEALVRLSLQSIRGIPSRLTENDLVLIASSARALEVCSTLLLDVIELVDAAEER